MTNITRLLSASAVIALLSACGGGGGTSGPRPTTPAPTAPASTSTADLVAFVGSGATQTTLDSGVTRRTRNFTEGGAVGTVAVDRLAGTDIGLVQYRLGDDVFIYRLTGEPVASMTLPSGAYNGPLDMNYSLDGGTSWSAMSGEANLSLDFATGEVGIGGIASDSKTSIELFGDAVLVDNRFIDTGTTLRLRDAAAGGTFVRDETGTVQGVAASHNGNQAIFGLVDGVNAATGFQASGGFTATAYPD